MLPDRRSARRQCVGRPPVQVIPQPKQHPDPPTTARRNSFNHRAVVWVVPVARRWGACGLAVGWVMTAGLEGWWVVVRGWVWLVDGAGCWGDGGVAVPGGGGEGGGSVGVVGGFPAPGGGVFDDVVQFAVDAQVGEVRGTGLCERGAVVAVGFAGGAVAVDPVADRVRGQQRLGHRGSRVVAGGGGFEDGAVGGVGEDASPGAVGGDAACHLGGDGSVAGQVAGVVVEPEEGVDRGEDFDVWSASLLVG